MEKISHFIFPYIIPNDPKFGWELKYSIRSLYKNFEGDFDITVIGEIPKWINKEVVNCIEFNTRTSHPGVQARVNHAYRIASKNFNEFIEINDDMYLIKPANKETFLTPRYINDNLNYSETSYKGLNRFQRNIRNTSLKLKSLGKQFNLNYTSHIPRVYNTKKFIEISDLFNINNPKNKESHLAEGAYYQYYNMPGIHIGSYRAGFWGPNNSKDQLKEATILNHDENGYLAHLWIKDYLQKEFPDKCPAELL